MSQTMDLTNFENDRGFQRRKECQSPTPVSTVRSTGTAFELVKTERGCVDECERRLCVRWRKEVDSDLARSPGVALLLCMFAKNITSWAFLSTYSIKVPWSSFQAYRIITLVCLLLFMQDDTT
jgi:hypothetical protein